MLCEAPILAVRRNEQRKRRSRSVERWTSLTPVVKGTVHSSNQSYLIPPNAVFMCHWTNHGLHPHLYALVSQELTQAPRCRDRAALAA